MISERTPLEVWRVATNHLLNCSGEDYYLILTFPSAAAIDETSLRTFDPRSTLGSKFDSARDVANTIFPLRTWERAANRTELYERYLAAHARSRRKSWGTYFQRMISFGGSKTNQLERVFSALSDWPGSYRAALLIHTSSADTDRLRPRGGPCLQYIQFCCPEAGIVDLFAVYRNHDYTNKVLGNLFGLGRLLHFVAGESGLTAGQVTCISVHAFIATSRKRQRELADLD